MQHTELAIKAERNVPTVLDLGVARSLSDDAERVRNRKKCWKGGAPIKQLMGGYTTLCGHK